MTVQSHASPLFFAMLDQARLPLPLTEYAFAAPERRWRFDFAWPRDGYIALEIEGGVFVAGRHSRGAGMLKDMEKYNAATVRGWSELRVVPKQLCTTATIEMLRLAFSVRIAA